MNTARPTSLPTHMRRVTYLDVNIAFQAISARSLDGAWEVRVNVTNGEHRWFSGDVTLVERGGWTLEPATTQPGGWVSPNILRAIESLPSRKYTEFLEALRAECAACAIEAGALDSYD